MSNQNTKRPVCDSNLTLDSLGNQLATTAINLSDLEIPSNEPEAVPNLNYGWVCPKCGAVMSPYQNFCLACSSSNFEITY